MTITPEQMKEMRERLASAPIWAKADFVLPEGTIITVEKLVLEDLPCCLDHIGDLNKTIDRLEALLTKAEEMANFYAEAKDKKVQRPSGLTSLWADDQGHMARAFLDELKKFRGGEG